MKKLSSIVLLSILSTACCTTAVKPAPATETQVTQAQVACTDPRPQMCTMNYLPVCATLKSQANKTYSNGCGACSDADVQYYVAEACPE